MSTSAADLGGSAKSAFTRTASGLVREMSIWDAAMFGLLATGGVYSFVYLFPFPQYFSPGFSAPGLILLTLGFAILSYVCYAALGSAMPRAGGDYLYQSRTVHRVVGFDFPWACQVVSWLLFPVTGAYVVNTLGIVPIFQAFGLIGAADWLLTPIGGFIVAVCFIIVAWSLCVLGLRAFRKAQRFVIIPFMLIGLATIIGILLANWGTDFTSAFNGYANSGGITADQVRSAAGEAGYAPAGFDFRNTLVWIGVLAGIIPYTMYAAQGLLGEVKDASNFRRLFATFAIPGVFMALCMLLLPWLLLQHIAGTEFLSQYAFAYSSGAIAPPYTPNINVFAQMLAPNKWVVLLMSLGFIGGGFGIGSTVFMNAARVMMAMSLDGLLPTTLSKVSRKFYTPVIAITIWSACAVGVAVWFNYGDITLVLAILATGMVTSTAVVGVTCLGAALFKWRAPDIFATAPAASWRVGSLPAISIIGAVAAAWVGVMVYWALFLPELGMTTRSARIYLVIAFGSGLVLYFIWRFVRQARGIDVSLTTREVPPE